MPCRPLVSCLGAPPAAGTTKISTSPRIAFTEANGTYAFTVANNTGYTSSPGSGSIFVSGGDVSMSITFAAASSAPSGSPSSRAIWAR